MKKVLTFIVLVFLSTSLFAGGNDGDFVQTDENFYYLKTLRYGVKSFLVGTLENGEKIKFAKEDVIAFKKDGERFDKVAIVKDNVCTDNYCFMQLVAYKNSLKVYKHVYYGTDGELTSRHYVFKNEQFVVKFDRENKESLLAFFEGSNK